MQESTIFRITVGHMHAHSHLHERKCKQNEVKEP